MLKTNHERITLPLATALFAVGIALGMMHEPASLHSFASGVRWSAVALLAIYALRRRSLTVWIFVAMVAGAELGFDAPSVAVNMRVFSDIFLRLIKTIVAPLILATLITGIAGHGDLKSVGRMGIKSLVYFEVATTFALVIGLIAINLSRAGVGLSMPTSPLPGETVPAAAATHWQDFLLHVFPENIAKSIAEGQILQVAVFAIFFGIALACLSQEKRAPMLSFFSSLAEVMFKFTNVVMYFAPIGVGAAMAFTVGQMGLGVLINLGKLLLTLYVALIAYALLVLLPSALLFRVPLRSFLSAVAEPATIAFATSSSEAALPRSMEAMEALGVPRRIVAFVIPGGLQLQLRRFDPLPRSSEHLRRAGRRHSSFARRTAPHHADADANQQRRCGRSTLRAGPALRHRSNVPPAHRAHLRDPRHRRRRRHGPHSDQRNRQLPRQRHRCEVGGSIRRRGRLIDRSRRRSRLSVRHVRSSQGQQTQRADAVASARSLVSSIQLHRWRVMRINMVCVGLLRY